MESQINKQLGEIALRLAGSEVELSLELKLKVAELVLRLTHRSKSFGLFVILGWKKEWTTYLDISDSEQDIFAKRNLNIMKMEVGAGECYRDVASTLDFDGAILIDRRGLVEHSGVFIEGLRPRQVANRLHHGKFKDLSEQFGFKSKVHARHLSAITASYVFKGTTVYTVSEENDDVHIFEGGHIVHTLKS
jgi:hypothetical protein